MLCGAARGILVIGKTNQNQSTGAPPGNASRCNQPSSSSSSLLSSLSSSLARLEGEGTRSHGLDVPSSRCHLVGNGGGNVAVAVAVAIPVPVAVGSNAPIYSLHLRYYSSRPICVDGERGR